VATGGYALKTYERFARIKQENRPLARHQSAGAAKLSLNVGTIVEEAMLKVRLVRSRGAKGNAGSTGALGRGGRMLGEIEEYFIEGLVVAIPLCLAARSCLRAAFGRRCLCLAPMNRRQGASIWAASFRSRPISPSGSEIARRQARLERLAGSGCATGCRAGASVAVPGVRELVVETFPRADKHYLVCYPLRAAGASDARDAFDAAARNARAPGARFVAMNMRWRCGIGRRVSMIGRPARSRRTVRS